MHRAVLFCGIFIAVAATPFLIEHAHAQVLGSTDPLTVEVSPQYPAPYDSVTVTPQSTVFNLAASAVTITVNGKVFYKGSGQQDVSIPLGGPGVLTTIVVSAVSGGQTYKKTLSIRPASVALVVEPVSTTHPFYRGAGLIGSEGPVRLIAIPDLRSSAGTQLNPSSLVYTWKLGEQILEGDSGIGKSILNATAPQRYQDVNVSVTVTSQDNSLVAQTSTPISPVDPFVRMYEDNPLLGPNFDIALQNTVNMFSAESTYRGVGYYFSEAPVTVWSVNGVQSGTDSDITVRSTGNGQGTAELNFNASQSDTAQTANSTVAVSFGKKPSSGFFGL